MAARTAPPEVGTYRYVLRRCSPLNPRIVESVSCRGEASKRSRDITHPDGKRRRTIYVKIPPTRNRLLKLGWEDVTALWEAQAKVEEPPKNKTASRKPEPVQTGAAIVEEVTPVEVMTPKPTPKPKPVRRRKSRKSA